jgi:hypothetical protein
MFRNRGVFQLSLGSSGCAKITRQQNDFVIDFHFSDDGDASLHNRESLYHIRGIEKSENGILPIGALLIGSCAHIIRSG